MQRATRWFLGLLDWRPVQGHDLLPVDTIQFRPSARLELSFHAQPLGRWHGGALFGSLDGRTVHVLHATTLAPPGWGGHPLTPCLPFLVGVGQTTSALHGELMDWVGQWIAAPDGRLPERSEDLTWLTLGARQGLFDDHHPLIVIGLHEGYVDGRAYIWDEGEPVKIVCPLRPPFPD